MRKEQELVNVKRTYIFSMREMRLLLGIKGDRIKNSGLWRGRSPSEEEEGKPEEDDLYYIETEEGEPVST